MPRVPYSPIPSVQPDVVQPVQDQIHVNVPDLGMVGRAAQQFGVTTQQAGNMLADNAVKLQGFANETNAKEADINFAQKASEAYASYLSKEGKDAAGGYEDFQQQVRSIYQDVRGSLGNAEAQRMFDRSAVDRINYFATHGAIHAAQQTRVWQLGTADARAAQAMRDGTTSRDDPAMLVKQANTGAEEMASKGDLLGWSDEQKENARATYKSSYWTHVIDAAIADDPVKADALFQQVRGQMDGPTQEAIASHIRPRLESAQEAALVNRVTGTLGGGGAGNDGLWQRMLMRESGGQQFGPGGAPLISPAGAIGKAQVMPATAQKVAADLGIPYDENKLRTDAAYNEKIGRAYFDQQSQTFQNPMLAAAAYNAGPERVNEWIGKFGDPRTGAISEQDFANKIPFKETRDYVRATGAIGVGSSSATAGTAYPDRQAIITRAMDEVKDWPLERQQRVLSGVQTRLSIMEAAHAGERSAFQRKLNDTKAALEDGADVPMIDEGRIRQMFPAEKAAEEIADQRIAGFAGQQFKAMQWASPEETQGILGDLRSGQGPISTTLKSKLRDFGVEPAPGSDGTAENYSLRMRMYNKALEIANKRDAALRSDPAAYVRSSPLVGPLHDAAVADQNNPNKLKDYLDASLDLQTHLGVGTGAIPGSTVHALTKGQAEQVAVEFQKADPGTTDVGAKLAGYAGQYGEHWPQVWGDLQTLGKLPQSYRTLGIIQSPVGRREFQTMLQVAQEKGGRAKMEELVTTQQRDAIRDELATKMPEFNATAYVPGAGGDPELGAQITNDVRSLAHFYSAMEGVEGGKAVDRAYQTILGDRYDFSGAQRFPKGQKDAVLTAEDNLLANLKPTDLAPSLDTQARAPEGGAAGPPLPGLTVAQRQERSMDFIRSGNGVWIMNHSDTGAHFYGHDVATGALVPIRRADGSPIELRWKDVRPAVASAVPGAPATTQGGVESLP